MKERYLPPGMRHGSEAYELLADCSMHLLSGGEWKVAFYIARRTIGFGKETDAISLSQFCLGVKKRNGEQLDHGTGLSRQAVVAALRRLTARGFVVAKPAASSAKPNIYRLNWQAIEASSQEQTSQESKPHGSQESGPQVVKKVDTQLSVQLSTLQLSITDDYLTTSRKKRNSSPDHNPRAPDSDFQPETLKTLLTTWMDTIPDDRILEKIVAAANGLSLAEFRTFFENKFAERNGRYRPAAKLGPRSFPWFVEVLNERAGRTQPTAPSPDWRLPRQQFDKMTGGFDTLDDLSAQAEP